MALPFKTPNVVRPYNMADAIEKAHRWADDRPEAETEARKARLERIAIEGGHTPRIHRASAMAAVLRGYGPQTPALPVSTLEG